MACVVSKYQRSSDVNPSPFDHVPSELLLAIIKLTQVPIHSTGTADDDAVEKCLQNMENAVASSNVSSYWRHVALSLPSLWAEFVLTDPAAQVFAIRSASHLLRLVASKSDERNTQFMVWLPDNVDRIESLSIISGCQDTIGNIFDAFEDSTTYPRMTRLDIWHDRALEDNSLFYPAVTTFMPNLRILHISQVSMDITKFTDLTELILRCTFYDIDRFKCSVDDLLELIHRSPRLEMLILEEVLLEPPMNSSSSRIELPQLRSLCLRDIFGGISGSRWLLTRIHVPSWTPAKAHSERRDSQFARSAWGMMTLHIDVRFCHRLKFGPDIKHIKSGMISLQDKYIDGWNVFAELFTAFDVTTMPELTIIINDRPFSDALNDIPAGVWTEFLARTPSLEVLHIMAPREWVEVVLSALCPQEARLVGYPCPKLQALRLEIVHSNIKAEQPESDTHDCVDRMDENEFDFRVVKFMERRQAYGCPLVHIALNIGNHRSLEALKEHVGHVEVIPD